MSKRRYIKIHMPPERFWVSLSPEDFANIYTFGDGTITTDKMVTGRVENNCISWPLKTGGEIPITGQTEIIEILDTDEVLDAQEIL